MTDHPITPPPELVVEWADTIYQQTEDDDQRDLYVATRAAQWGADQELEACVKLLELSDKNARDFLYSARRPESPSLKGQALQALELLIPFVDADDKRAEADTIRRALEQLDD